MNQKNIIKILIVAVLILAIYLVALNRGTFAKVNNFDECVAAGNPVMESFPRQCIHKGKNYTEVIYSTPTSADNAPLGSIHNLPVPEAVSKVRSLVASNTNTPVGRVIVMTAYEKEWSDSCFGLGGPAESCAAVITPGYEVTVQSNGQEYTYRTNSDGTVLRQKI